MKRAKGFIFGAGFGLMALAAVGLADLKNHHALGAPGVVVGRVPIYDEHTNLVAQQSVVLPQTVLGIRSMPLPVTSGEVTSLPQDTTFGRRFYRSDNGDFGAQISVVLMGTDHTSIHQPQYCLYAQDWNVMQTERVSLPMQRPHPYSLPAVKLTAQRQLPSGQTVECFYVYWFVSGEKITAEEGSRLWSMWSSVLRKGRLERWAYISYFVTCLPGHEQSTFSRLEQFISASAPEFQLVGGASSDAPGSLTARR